MEGRRTACVCIDWRCYRGKYGDSAAQADRSKGGWNKQLNPLPNRFWTNFEPNSHCHLESEPHWREKRTLPFEKGDGTAACIFPVAGCAGFCGVTRPEENRPFELDLSYCIESTFLDNRFRSCKSVFHYFMILLCTELFAATLAFSSSVTFKRISQTRLPRISQY